MKHQAPGPVAVIRDAQARALEAADAIADPFIRIQALNDAIDQSRDLVASLASARALIVRELTQRLRAEEVASALGISRARVYAILSERKAR